MIRDVLNVPKLPEMPILKICLKKLNVFNVKIWCLVSSKDYDKQLKMMKPEVIKEVIPC